MKKGRFDAAQVKRAAVIVRVLNNKERLRMISLLESTTEMRPMDFVEEMGLAANRVQLHLTMLSGIGMVRRKVITRKEVYYYLYKDRAAQVSAGLRIISIKDAHDYVNYVRFGTVA